MKKLKIYLIGSLFCVIAFTQCNKEESISEIIAQVEEDYENLDKVVTIWEEGCGKEWADMAEELKLFDSYFTENNGGISRKIAYNNLWDIMVIRVDDNCGNYPTVFLHQDNEDSNPTTKVVYNNATATWISNGVFATQPKRDLNWYFCLVPITGFPTYALKGNDSYAWAALLIDPDAMHLSYNPNNRIIQRHMDCEDTNPNTYADYKHDRYSSFVKFDFSGLRPDLAKNIGKAFFFNSKKDLWFTFLQFNDMHPTQPTCSFPNLGFNYAVFNKTALTDDFSKFAIVFSDDEDKNNVNGWNYENKLDFELRNRGSLNYGFVNGLSDTEFFISLVDHNKIFYNY